MELLPARLRRPGEHHVVPLNMKNYINILLLLLVSIIACAGKDYVVVTGDGLIHPMLKMEVVEIPSKGTVICINGEAEIKKDGTNEYVPVEMDTSINENDIVWLKKKAEVKIVFKDGSFILNEPQAKDVFITFNMANTDKMPK